MPRYSPEVKAAVIAQLLAGASLAEAAKIHGVSKSIAKKWADDNKCTLVHGKRPAGDLIETYVRTAFAALIKHAEIAQDEDWLKQHEPNSVAVLHGVIADKLYAVLDRARRTFGDEDTNTWAGNAIAHQVHRTDTPNIPNSTPPQEDS
jgi:transposase-like protein